MIKRLTSSSPRAAFAHSLLFGTVGATLFFILSLVLNFGPWQSEIERHSNWVAFQSSTQGAFCSRLNNGSLTEDDVVSVQKRAAELYESRRSYYSPFNYWNQVSDEALRSLMASGPGLSSRERDGGYLGALEGISNLAAARRIFSECEPVPDPGNLLWYATQASWQATLAIFAVVSALVASTYGFLLFWAKQRSLGWRRLSIVVAAVVTLLAAIYGLVIAENDEDIFFLLVLWLPGVFFSTLIATLFSNTVRVWVREGFEGPTASHQGSTSNSYVDQASESVNLRSSGQYANQEEPSPSVHLSIDEKTTYWRRLWARGIDLFVIYVIFNIVGVFIPDDFGTPTAILLGILLQALVLSLLVLAYDTLLVAKFGTTLGKSVFGLKVLSIDHTRPSFLQAYKRAKSALFGGLYLFLFFPALQVYGAWKARKPSWTGLTPWDAAGRSYVQCAAISPVRKWVCYVLSAVLLTTVVVVSKMAKEVTKEQIRDSVIQQHSR
jgi:uncharacterized RDD family membrane protein YckC